MHCVADRISTGSGQVLPALRKKLPLERFGRKTRFLVMPAVLTGVLILAFSKPPSLWVIVPLWLFFAHRFGYVRHIHEAEESDDGEEAEGSAEEAEDSGDRTEGQQSEEAREGGFTASRH
jgi:hypothetical protein